MQTIGEKLKCDRIGTTIAKSEVDAGVSASGSDRAEKECQNKHCRLMEDATTVSTKIKTTGDSMQRNETYVDQNISNIRSKMSSLRCLQPQESSDGNRLWPDNTVKNSSRTNRAPFVWTGLNSRRLKGRRKPVKAMVTLEKQACEEQEMSDNSILYRRSKRSPDAISAPADRLPNSVNRPTGTAFVDEVSTASTHTMKARRLSHSHSPLGDARRSGQWTSSHQQSQQISGVSSSPDNSLPSPSHQLSDVSSRTDKSLPQQQIHDVASSLDKSLPQQQQIHGVTTSAYKSLRSQQNISDISSSTDKSLSQQQIHGVASSVDKSLPQQQQIHGLASNAYKSLPSQQNISDISSSTDKSLTHQQHPEAKLVEVPAQTLVKTQDKKEETAAPKPTSLPKWRFLSKCSIGRLATHRQVTLASVCIRSGAQVQAAHMQRTGQEMADPADRLIGMIKVKNIAYEKSVFVRVTGDRWKTFTDHPALYITSRSGVSADMSLTRKEDTFTFQTVLPRDSDRVEFAIQYAWGKPGGEASGTDWDNNEGSNYVAVREKPEQSEKPVPDAETKGALGV